jgi:MarR family 2-MHQ and catechol resistance regulon transcriptional repressor
MSTIAKSQTVAKSTVSSTVNVLERRELVKRIPVTEDGDGRLVQVELTDSGRDLIEEVFPKFNAGEKSFVEGLTQSEMETLATLLRKLVRVRRKNQT